jgi:hypothetical protein
MRTIAIATLLTAGIVVLAASPAWPGTMEGTVKVGGVIKNESGDRSTVQETYGIYDGFSLTQIRLTGSLDPGNYLSLDLREINLDSRQGDFLFRRPGTFKLTANFDQSRYVFDPDRVTTAERKDWRVGAQYTPYRWLNINGSYNYLMREGERLPYPPGTESVLGESYDNVLQTGLISVEAQKDRRGGAITYQASGYADDLNSGADRRGHVISARAYLPDRFIDRWTHMLRGSYGVRRLKDGDLEYTMSDFQYTAVVQVQPRLQLRYNFEATRHDHEATDLKTIRFQNIADATYHHPYGHLNAGYAYETNDDRTLTHYNSWRAGGSFRLAREGGQGSWLTAKLDYAERTKKDEEQLTLLRDVEASKLRGSLELRPVEPVVVGGRYLNREREMPDIAVKAEGEVWSGWLRAEHKAWGSVSADYSWTKDTYTDLVAGFVAGSSIVTARADFVRIRNLTLAGGVTYLDIGEDLDIEKSMVFAEGSFRFLKDYRLEARYNCYNYDDYILLDRYYTANVLRIDLAYDLHL